MSTSLDPLTPLGSPVPTPPAFPRLGIGAGSLANAGGEQAFTDTVRRAFARGVRYFDTSAFYLGGESERRLGAALAPFARDELRLSTKIGRYQNHTGSSIDPHNRNSYYDYSAATTRRSVERSLERLGVSRLDAVFVHDLDHRLCGADYDTHFAAARDEAYPALARLKADGLIRAIGVAAMDWRACLQFAEAVPLDVVMPAGEYSLLRVQSVPLLDFCHARSIPWIAASPFNSGILATGARDDAFYDMRPASPAALSQVRALEALCARHGVPLAAAAAQFPLRHPAVSTVVFGAKSPEELDETLALCERPIPQDAWSEIEGFVAAHADWETARPPSEG